MWPESDRGVPVTGPTRRSHPNRTGRPHRGPVRGARLTAGVAGLSLVAGALAGIVGAGITGGEATAGEATVGGAGPATLAAGRPVAAGVPQVTSASAAPAAPVAAPALHGAAGSATTSVRGWTTPDASVTAPAPAVVGAVAPGQPVRIVTVRSVGGRPAVTTRTVTGPDSATAAVASAQEDDTTLSVGVDRVLHLTDVTTSNDKYRTAQWALTTLRAEKTWTVTTGVGASGTPVTVAVVDTGVQRNHPDLAGVVLSGIDLVADNPASTDGSNDENGHGTHVAGIVGAIANNSIGVAGLAPGVRILPVRVLDGDGSGYDSDVADGIVKAVDRGAGVINLSVGGGTEAGATGQAVKYALSKNVVVVAAAGNERQDGNAISYPAADDGVIGVAATDSSNKDAPFSNTGAYVDLAAPGVSIWSTYKGSTYKALSGTSMATPYVSAAAALARSVAPGLTPAAVTDLLERTATDLDAPGRDDATGYGLVDPYAAVCSLVSCDPGSTPPTTGPTTPAAPAASVFGLTTGPGRTVVAGTSIAVSGTLTDAASGAPLAGRAAEICVRTAPATTFGCVTAVTAADGSLGVTGSPTATTWIYLVFRGTGENAASRTATAAYPVTARVTLRAGSKSLTATVSPARGQKVNLDRWTGTAWTPVTSKTVAQSGSVQFTKLKPATYRVRVGATNSTAASTSGSLKVT